MIVNNKFFDLKNYKNKLSDAERELDNLANNEGWLVVASCGKDNQILVLRKVVETPQQEYPQQYQQEQYPPQRYQQQGYQPQQASPVKRRKQGKEVPFPNAVYQ